MRILILGAGKMGSFFTDILSFQHETAVFDVNPHQLRFVYNTYRFTTLEEIKEFEPELVINAATVKYTLDAFRQVLPVLPKDCIISDIASVKTGLKKFYEESGFRYVSTHPMFGPTFASLSNLNTENAIENRDRHEDTWISVFLCRLFLCANVNVSKGLQGLQRVTA